MYRPAIIRVTTIYKPFHVKYDYDKNSTVTNNTLLTHTHTQNTVYFCLKAQGAVKGVIYPNATFRHIYSDSQ